MKKLISKKKNNNKERKKERRKGVYLLTGWGVRVKHNIIDARSY
jgi:phage terminase large subunit GpA-like protein